MTTDLKRFGISAFGIIMMYLNAENGPTAIADYCKLKNVHEDNVALLSAAEVDSDAKLPGECRHRTLAFAKALQPGSPVWYEWTSDEGVTVTDTQGWDKLRKAERKAMDSAAKESGKLVLVGPLVSDPNCNRCRFVNSVKEREAADKRESTSYRCVIEIVAKESVRSMAPGSPIVLEEGEPQWSLLLPGPIQWLPHDPALLAGRGRSA